MITTDAKSVEGKERTNEALPIWTQEKICKKLPCKYKVGKKKDKLSIGVLKDTMGELHDVHTCNHLLGLLRGRVSTDSASFKVTVGSINKSSLERRFEGSLRFVEDTLLTSEEESVIYEGRDKTTQDRCKDSAPQPVLTKKSVGHKIRRCP